MFTSVVEKALKNEAPSGKTGYYFPETGEHSFKELAAEIANVLAARQKEKGDVFLESVAPSSFESDQVAGDLLAGGNVVFAGIGWGSKCVGLLSLQTRRCKLLTFWVYS